ncbi:MAG: hypothetical protein HYW81_00675 [Parcubacteria group bacterium]|nr:hypothetical protein [Parcubacteria group bacterium]
MSPRTKAIAIIAGSVILFGLLIATIFDLFPGEPEAVPSEEAPVVLPDRDAGLPEGAVFEAANADEFAATNPGAGSSAKQGAIEREAEELAVFFIERFGTYSSDAGLTYLDDLSAFLTAAMRSRTESYRLASPAREGFYSITAELASIEADSVSLGERSARFRVVVNRSEFSAGTTEAYQQDAVVSLVQSGSGEWLVDSVVWGDRR